MLNSMIQMAFSNACISLLLAVAAVVVGKTTKQPHLTYLLWLLVFMKLVTPPIVSVSVFMISVKSEDVFTMSSVTNTQIPENTLLASTWSTLYNYGCSWLSAIWLFGCFIVFLISMYRIIRFQCLLRSESVMGEDKLQSAAKKLARQFRLKTVPDIYVTHARISPMVWWIGGRVRIFIPSIILKRMKKEEWHWILAHELAHVKRGDYFVRWLEWLACVCFWWNPVVWWAQRNLRAMEEICCDALVMSTLNPKPQSYANSLLAAVEFLACPMIHTPAIASEMNSCGFLEHRFKMIVSKTAIQPKSKWMRSCMILFSVFVLPFGITYAHNGDTVSPANKVELSIEKNIDFQQQDQLANPVEDSLITQRKRLGLAVRTGELTREEAEEYFEGFKTRLEFEKQRELYQVMKRKIRVALQEGKISSEEAQTKLLITREQMFGKPRDQKKEKELNWDGIIRRIENEVASGKISRIEADAKYIEIKKQYVTK